MSAAESAVEMSEAAAVAAEEAMTAARLSGVHARAALEAARLALDLDKKLKTKNVEDPPDGARCLTPQSSASEPSSEVSRQSSKTKISDNVQKTVKKSVLKNEKFCRNCKLYYDRSPCLHAKFVFYVSAETVGMRLRTCGGGWSRDKQSKVCWVVGGDRNNVKVRWSDTSESKVEKFSLMNKNEALFQFWCKDEAEKESSRCKNCRLHKSRCLNEKFVLEFRRETVGMRVRARGSSWPDHLQSQSAKVIGGALPDQLEVEWTESKKEGFYDLQKNGSYCFIFDCKNSEEVRKGLKVNPMKESCFVPRLPLSSPSVWQHSDKEKHRILINASRDVSLTAVGLSVATTVDKVTVNISMKHQGFYKENIFQENFYNVDTSNQVVKFRNPILLSCDHIYLIILTMVGGASRVGEGGEEFVTVRTNDGEDVLFKFEEYKHKDDVPGQTTDVEKGLMERLYFKCENSIDEKDVEIVMTQAKVTRDEAVKALRNNANNIVNSMLELLNK